MPIMLGLQNGDALNFGVADFWSYFSPFETVAEEFDRAIDAWVSGDARVAVHRGRGRKLQMRDGDNWKTLYSANGGLFPILSNPLRFISNRPLNQQH
ncbi:hypothetical protein BWQ93_10510 [Sphingopyxis sp. QXT-31]|nr:hypothetical protein BWQ93_10510 [Sphingopyxis sp. QXT-31]